MLMVEWEVLAMCDMSTSNSQEINFYGGVGQVQRGEVCIRQIRGGVDSIIGRVLELQNLL